jgi:hypothetical protein
MSTIQYIPPSLAVAVANLPILCIYACAHPANPVEASGISTAGGQMTNHQIFHCVFSQNKSLRLNPSPLGPNLSMVLIVTRKSYSYSHNAVRIVQLPTPGLTFVTLVELLVSSKYDIYQFAAGGQGCRFWVHSVIDLLRSRGFVQNAAEL